MKVRISTSKGKRSSKSKTQRKSDVGLTTPSTAANTSGNSHQESGDIATTSQPQVYGSPSLQKHRMRPNNRTVRVRIPYGTHIFCIFCPILLSLTLLVRKGTSRPSTSPPARRAAVRIARIVIRRVRLARRLADAAAASGRPGKDLEGVFAAPVGALRVVLEGVLCVGRKEVSKPLQDDDSSDHSGREGDIGLPPCLGKAGSSNARS